MNKPHRYAKRPVVIEAWQLTKVNAEDVANWCGGRVGQDRDRGQFDPPHVDIPTLEGLTRASSGDFVIRGVKGEFYACKPDIFRLTYETPEATK